MKQYLSELLISRREIFMNKACYYLMKNGFILRMEDQLDEFDIPILIKENLLDPEDLTHLNQDQANYRVAIFRDQIVELEEYTQTVYGYSC
jgi:hypothetical protein